MSGANGERRSMVVEIREESAPDKFDGRRVYRAYNILGNPLHASAFRIDALKARLRDVYPHRDIAFLGPVTTNGGEFYRERRLAQIAMDISRTLGINGDLAQRLHELLLLHLLPSHCPFCVALHSEHAAKARTNPAALVRREEVGHAI